MNKGCWGGVILFFWARYSWRNQNNNKDIEIRKKKIKISFDIGNCAPLCWPFTAEATHNNAPSRSAAAIDFSGAITPCLPRDHGPSVRHLYLSHKLSSVRLASKGLSGHCGPGVKFHKKLTISLRINQFN